MRYNIIDFGAIANDEFVNTDAIAATIEECRLHGGGTIYIPTGTFKTGSIRLYSNMTLFLESGAELSFVNEIVEFPIIHTRWEGSEMDCYQSCIYAKDAQNIRITGYGIVNGNGQVWWQRFKEKNLAYPRPTLISLVNVQQIEISGIKAMNSPSWTLHPLQCENVTIDNVMIVNPKDSPNTDGINPESCNGVKISNCYIDVGDDCIAIKSGIETANARIPCKNIEITNCTMMHGHGGVVIGSEMSGSVQNVTISNCCFQDTDRGIRFKSLRGRGGIVEDIVISNIIMEDVLSPFIMNLYYNRGSGGNLKIADIKDALPITTETPCIRNVIFSNIIAKKVSVAGFLYGLPEMPIDTVSFHNIRVDIKNNDTPVLPAMLANAEPMQQAGFYIRNVKNMVLDNVKINGAKHELFDIDGKSDVKIK